MMYRSGSFIYCGLPSISTKLERLLMKSNYPLLTLFIYCKNIFNRASAQIIKLLGERLTAFNPISCTAIYYKPFTILWEQFEDSADKIFLVSFNPNLTSSNKKLSGLLFSDSAAPLNLYPRMHLFLQPNYVIGSCQLPFNSLIPIL
ncbi:hypothetical protein BH10BAC3_BH10BAC3_37370 [soil metagenome]